MPNLRHQPLVNLRSPLSEKLHVAPRLASERENWGTLIDRDTVTPIIPSCRKKWTLWHTLQVASPKSERINQIATFSVSGPADVTWGFQVFAGQSGDHMMPWRRCQQAGLNGTRQRRTLANCCSKFPYLSAFLRIGWSSLGIFLDTLSRSRFHKWNSKKTWSEEVCNLRIFSSNSAFTWTCLKSKQPWAEQLTTRSTCSWDIKGFKSAACSWPLEVNGASHMLPQQHSLRSTEATWKQVSKLFEDW